MKRILNIENRTELNIKISKKNSELLCCLKCHAKLTQMEKRFDCTNPECSAHFPVIDGIPILINKQSSVFSIDDFVLRRKTFFNNIDQSKLKKILSRLIATTSENIKGKSNLVRFIEILLKNGSYPNVLVIGGSILGHGIESLVNNSAIDLVETDVSYGPRTMLICDAHDIPFENQSFDGVIIQAVLEHVVDPYKCSEEIHRILKEKGLVYAETPFMQQVYGGRYDFTLFTFLGHRRLFRKFEEIDSGVACGPGMALAWSYQHFLSSFTNSRKLRTGLRIFASLTSFYLKYLIIILLTNQAPLMQHRDTTFWVKRESIFCLIMI